MKSVKHQAPILLAIAVSSTLLLGSPAAPQPTQDADVDHLQHKDHEKHMREQASEPSMEQQIAELRESVAKLELALKMNHQGTSRSPVMAGDSMQPGSAPAAMGMGAMAKKGMGGKKPPSAMGGMQPSTAMGGMQKGKAKMSPMKKGAMKKGPMGMGSMGMGMGGMKSMGAMPDEGMAISALPGFPGASHLYHIGATGFFLDHTDHIVLSTEQVMQMNQARESSSLAQASSQRNIDQAEQELWELTASETPDAILIDAKVREIESLRGDQRIAFIRAIGDAANLLSEGQRKQLAGMLPPGPSPDESSSMDSMDGGR